MDTVRSFCTRSDRKLVRGKLNINGQLEGTKRVNTRIAMTIQLYMTTQTNLLPTFNRKTNRRYKTEVYKLREPKIDDCKKYYTKMIERYTVGIHQKPTGKNEIL